MPEDNKKEELLIELQHLLNKLELQDQIQTLEKTNQKIRIIIKNSRAHEDSNGRGKQKKKSQKGKRTFKTLQYFF